MIILAVSSAFLITGFYLPQFEEIKIGVYFGVAAGFFYALYLWLKRKLTIKDYGPFQALGNIMIFSI